MSSILTYCNYKTLNLNIRRAGFKPGGPRAKLTNVLSLVCENCDKSKYKFCGVSHITWVGVIINNQFWSSLLRQIFEFDDAYHQK